MTGEFGSLTAGLTVRKVFEVSINYTVAIRVVFIAAHVIGGDTVKLTAKTGVRRISQRRQNGCSILQWYDSVGRTWPYTH